MKVLFDRCDDRRALDRASDLDTPGARSILIAGDCILLGHARRAPAQDCSLIPEFRASRELESHPGGLSLTGGRGDAGGYSPETLGSCGPSKAGSSAATREARKVNNLYFAGDSQQLRS
jgi:hypothetical protein